MTVIQVLILAGCVVAMIAVRWHDRDLLKRRRP